MESLQKYVPQRSDTSTLTLPHGETMTVDRTQFSPVLFGGDQLTATRARGCADLREILTLTGRLKTLLYQKTGTPESLF